MAISKKFLKNKPECKVTFIITAEEAGNAETMALVGDFNNWSESANPLKKQTDGSFKIAITLPTGLSYKFRYLDDGSRWINDPAADGYEYCSFAAGENSLLNL